MAYIISNLQIYVQVHCLAPEAHLVHIKYQPVNLLLCTESVSVSRHFQVFMHCCLGEQGLYSYLPCSCTMAPFNRLA